GEAGIEIVAARIVVPAAARGAAAFAFAAIEQDQHGVEALQYDLRRIFVLAVIALPFAGLQRAFQIDLAALAQIFLGDIGEAFAENRDRMPFGLFLALAAVAVLPAFGRGNATVHDLAAVLKAAGFGVAAEVADEDHLVDRAGLVFLRS